MDKKKKGLLVGLVLGDGSIGTSLGKYPIFQIEHCAKQFDYLDYKRQLIEKLFKCGTINIHKRQHTNKQTNKVYPSYKITKNHRFLKVLKPLIYSNFGKKYFSERALSYLTPEGLAIWYMDDGSLTRKYTKLTNKFTTYYVTLATFCTEQEADNIINFFSGKFDINIKKRFNKRTNSWFHEFNRINTDKFLKLIENFIIPSMQYKLPGYYTPRALATYKERK